MEQVAFFMSANALTIIGSGLAGYHLAKAWRQYQAAAPLTLYTADGGEFYPKPQLSTSLRMQKTPDAIVSKTAAEMAAELNAEVHPFTSVMRINRQAKTLTLACGKTVAYQTLVLATGSKTCPVPLQGDAVADVLTVNDLQAYRLFRQRLVGKKKIAILGSGLVGCEFANDLIASGHKVVVISPDAYPLAKWVPEPVGRLLQRLLAAAGVDWRFNDLATRVDHDADSYGLHLQSGEKLQADLLLSAVGIRAHCQLAAASGLDCARGIVINDKGQTSDSAIYALGDCAEFDGEVRQYITPLKQAADVIAGHLSGEAKSLSYPVMPISIKTADCRIVVALPRGCPPAAMAWQFDDEADPRRVLLYRDKQLIGFVLTREALAERFDWMKKLAR